MIEFRSMQQQCKRLQRAAQAMGMADDGEGGLNCFDDYREKMRLEDTEKAIASLATASTPGMAEFLSTLKMPKRGMGTRNMLTVMGIVRDMGPDDSKVAWLPRPSQPEPPTLPEAIKKAEESAACP